MAAGREIARLLLQAPRVAQVVIGAAAAADPVQEVWGRVGVVVLATGAGQRFGALKQLLAWRGVPLVAHVAGQALACPDVHQIVVTVGAEAARVREALYTGGGGAMRDPATPAAAGVRGDDRLQVTEVADWAAGQSRSVQAGLAAVGHQWSSDAELAAVIFLLADQPGVSPALLATLIQRHRETLAPVVAPRHAGRRGNPVLFDRATFREFASLQGDVGARPIIQAHWEQVAWVDWPTPEVLEDIDTPNDYTAYRSK